MHSIECHSQLMVDGLHCVVVSDQSPQKLVFHLPLISLILGSECQTTPLPLRKVSHVSDTSIIIGVSVSSVARALLCSQAIFIIFKYFSRLYLSLLSPHMNSPSNAQSTHLRSSTTLPSILFSSISWNIPVRFSNLSNL